ncbi:rhodanese-like domain-containing protein [Leptospira sp. 'Mane']|uniref:rhodanese-like domain-containing protein n=1 Tax=Leptospira sp. 'Mane' TaxID=3387407 RepID=UPI00398A6B60
MRSSLTTDSAKVKQKITEGALVVDVRTAQEFEITHFPGAVNIPVDQLEIRLSEFGAKDRSIVVYCASGGRSSSAKSLLESKGFKDVLNAGGLSNMPKD